MVDVYQNARSPNAGIHISIGVIAVLSVLTSGCALDDASDARVVQSGSHTMSPRDGADDASNLPAPVAPAGPHLDYHGGNLITNARVVEVLYGSGSYIPQMTATSGLSMASAYDQMLGSGVIDWLNEYNAPPDQNLGRGFFIGSTQIAPASGRNGSNISDANIQAELAAQIAAHVLPPPNDDELYMIHFPSGKSISGPPGVGNSCVDPGFCAYHGTFKIGMQLVFYGVMPDLRDGLCATECGSGTTFQNQMSAASHEMVEAITDPTVGLSSSGVLLGWYDPHINPATNQPYGEIGDICNGQHGSFIGMDGNEYTIQREWSNQQNACITTRNTATSGGPVAFQANTGTLWIVGPGGNGETSLNVMAGTSPSIAVFPNGGYEVAFQAPDGNLWSTGIDIVNAQRHITNWQLGMKAATSPAITSLPGGGFEIAFQANDGNLWTAGKLGTGVFGATFGMMAGTSPSIAALSSGGIEIAFQANSGLLWAVGAAGNGVPGAGLGMMAGTSPAISPTSNGSFEIAFQANDGSLWHAGPSDLGPVAGMPKMMAGTSPNMTALTGGGHQIVFQANTGFLWQAGGSGPGLVGGGLGMMAGTSPTITALPSGGGVILFQANTGFLWTAGNLGVGLYGAGYGMKVGTSPSRQ